LSPDLQTASTLLEGASTVLHFNLNKTGKEFLPVAKELDASEKLLSMESFRFLQRLESGFTVEKTPLENHRLHAMLLYSLVDQGLKQTVYFIFSKTSLNIRVYITGSLLYFTLVPFLSESAERPGITITQWQEPNRQLTLRAKGYYPTGFSTQIFKQDNRLMVFVTLPLL
jgi:hypothetical protein